MYRGKTCVGALVDKISPAFELRNSGVPAGRGRTGRKSREERRGEGEGKWKEMTEERGGLGTSSCVIACSCYSLLCGS
jgi:hypothetical protein